jgi:hypothetical protein
MEHSFGTLMPEDSFEDSSGQLDFRAPTMATKYVGLRCVNPEDYRLMRAGEQAGELGVRWRFRGGSLSPEDWSRALWQSVLAQFIVVAIPAGTPLGLVVAYRPSFQDRHAYFAARRWSMGAQSPLFLLGSALFLDYVFTCWDFRKLYMEVPEFNMPQFASGLGRLIAEEGRLRGHYWFDGRHWDQVILALYRARWTQLRDRFLPGDTG